MLRLVRSPCIALGMIGLAASLPSCKKEHHRSASGNEVQDTDREDDDGEKPPEVRKPSAVQVFVDPLTSPRELPPAEQQWWMDKTYRAFTGKELTNSANESQLRTLKRLDFIQAVMKEPGFVDTIAAFNMYFLGFKNGSMVDSSGNISRELFAMPQAITGAKAIAEGGDYLNFFAFEQPIYLGEPGRARLPSSNSSESSTANESSDQPPTPILSNAEIRAQLEPQIMAILDQLIVLGNGPEDQRGNDVCALAQGFDDSKVSLADLLSDLGLPRFIDETYFESAAWFKEVFSYCFLPLTAPPDLVTPFEKAKEKIPALIAALNDLDTQNYQPKNISSLKSVENTALPPSRTEALTSSFYQNLGNSSTNYDRRRSSYILKRYFCDDLTPISIAQPEVHAGNKHASDPSCKSCHYKLDPMAGFFRNVGFFGMDFSGSPLIFFDDFAQKDLDSFASTWRADKASGRDWDIGYVRSVAEPKLNDYGESLPDLFKIIRNARETKQCLVKRMFEYYVAEDQIMDAGYVSYLTDKFELESKTSSSEALKRTLTRLAISETFSQPDIVSSECYDYAPGDKIGTRPPCRVNFLLQKHCATCHSASGAAGGLDLTSWNATATDDATFPHVKGGKQQTKMATFLSIYDRLTTTDVLKRMPLDKYIPSADQEQLFLWTNDILSDLEKSKPKGGK